jgi:hypothetical protein
MHCRLLVAHCRRSWPPTIRAGSGRLHRGARRPSAACVGYEDMVSSREAACVRRIQGMLKSSRASMRSGRRVAVSVGTDAEREDEA